MDVAPISSFPLLFSSYTDLKKNYSLPEKFKCNCSSTLIPSCELEEQAEEEFEHMEMMFCSSKHQDLLQRLKMEVAP